MYTFPQGLTVTNYLIKNGGGDFIIRDQNGVSEREAQFYNVAGTLHMRSDLNADNDKLGNFKFESANVEITGNLNVNGGVYKNSVRGLPSDDLRPTISYVTKTDGAACIGGLQNVLSIQGLTVNVNSKIIITAKISGHVNSASTGSIEIDRNAVTLPSSVSYVQSGNYYGSFSTEVVDTVSAGTYNYDVVVYCPGAGQMTYVYANMIAVAYAS